jgi:kynurenine formamidase
MIYDVTHTIMTSIPHFPGNPEPLIEAGHAAPPWRVSAQHLGSHSGTHVDAPRHYLPDGRGIDAYPPAQGVTWETNHSFS